MASESHQFANVSALTDLPSDITAQLEHFFSSYNAFSGKVLKVTARRGPRPARRLLESLANAKTQAAAKGVTVKLATYNVNGVNGRLSVLLQWLEQTAPDVVCLQELKSPDEKFPVAAIEKAGYGAIWHGQKSWNGVAILAKGQQPEETRRGLPGDPDDTHSRYIEATIAEMIIGCLYLPNGNPAPGPKFDYKLAWFKRLHRYAKQLLKFDAPVILVGDFNVIPSEVDARRPESWKDDALFFPESRAAFQTLLKQGWTDALRTLYPDEAIYTFWDYFRNSFARDAGIRIDHFLLNELAIERLSTGGVDREVRSWEKTSDHAPVWIKLKSQTQEQITTIQRRSSLR